LPERPKGRSHFQVRVMLFGKVVWLDPDRKKEKKQSAMFTNPNIMMWQRCSPSPQPQLSSKKNTSLWNACNYHPRFKVQRLRAQSGPDIYVWDTTSSHPHPIRIFTGHTGVITSLVFSSPSSLISSSQDYLVKLWEIGTLQADPAMADLEPILLKFEPLPCKQKMVLLSHVI